MPLNGKGGGSKETGEGGVNVAGWAIGRERGSVCGREGIFQVVCLSWVSDMEAREIVGSEKEPSGSRKWWSPSLLMREGFEKERFKTCR
jgi:hypothetical protein